MLNIFKKIMLCLSFSMLCLSVFAKTSNTDAVSDQKFALENIHDKLISKHNDISLKIKEIRKEKNKLKITEREKTREILKRRMDKRKEFNDSMNMEFYKNATEMNRKLESMGSTFRINYR